MNLPERVAHQMLKELAEISGCVRKPFQARELAASHKLEQMRRVQVLEQRAIWTRKTDFDRIETIAETYEETLRRLHAEFDPGPVYTGLYNARRSPTLEESHGYDRGGGRERERERGQEREGGHGGDGNVREGMVTGIETRAGKGTRACTGMSTGAWMGRERERKRGRE